MNSRRPAGGARAPLPAVGLALVGLGCSTAPHFVGEGGGAAATTSTTVGTTGAGGAGGDGGAGPEVLWAERFGDAAAQSASWVVIDGAGDLVVAGEFAGSIDLGSGPLTSAGDQDIFVAKLTLNGNLLWAQRFGGAGLDTVGKLAVGADGSVVLAGSFMGDIAFGGLTMTSAGSSDVFVAKLTSGGGAVWAKRFGDAAAAQGERGGGVAIGEGGAIYVATQFFGTIDLGLGAHTSQGEQDILVAKLDASGTPVWSVAAGSPTADSCSSVAVAPDGSILVAGGHDAGFHTALMDLASAGGHDVFALRLDAGGTLVDAKGYGSLADDAAHATSARAFVGVLGGPTDFGVGDVPVASAGDAFVARYDVLGGVAWAKAFGGAKEELFTGVVEDAQGNEILTGAAASVVDFGGGALPARGGLDAVVVALDAAGSHMWSRRFGGPGADSAMTAAVAPDGSVVVVGAFEDTADFGGGIALTSAGDRDAFVLRLVP